MMEKKLHYQYVMLQCSFYAMSACFIGYMVPVLQTQGFKHTQIGFFLALRALFSVIFQPIIANVMDKFKSVISFNQLIAVMIVISMM
ncbi:MFS transporter, partial [Jeotgalibaca porci]|uniref:MFS transporter n=4 Tax=Jeotgalibaca porci TaxID=1868793 RepID=UPI00359F8F46